MAWTDATKNQWGYRDRVDYSLEIRNATNDADIKALQAERQAKIDHVYGGKDPYTTPAVNAITGNATKPTNTAAQYGSTWNPQTATAADSEAYRKLQNSVNQQAQSRPVPQQQPPVPQQQPPAPDVRDTFKGYLDQWLQGAQQQAKNQVDQTVNQSIADLTRAQQDAATQFQTQRNEIAIDEAKAKDNQALYAERRGDKGGIGAAQYDAIMNTAAQNRLQVNSAQQKLSTDTARQIADLRAQGEFEKADALLELTQQYLSQLMSLEQWSMEFGLSVAQFNASLQQWQAEYDMAVADLTGYYNGKPTLAYQNNLAEQGWAMLAAGMPPTESQLAAMGLTGAQAQSYITAQKLAAQQKGKGTDGGGDPAGDPAMTLTLAKEYAGQGIFNDAVVAALKKGNYSDELILSKYPEYEDYMRQKDLEAAGIETVMKKFDQEANAISSWLQQGMVGNADARVKLLLENGVIGEQEYALLDDLYRRLGYELKVTFE